MTTDRLCIYRKNTTQANKDKEEYFPVLTCSVLHESESVCGFQSDIAAMQHPLTPLKIPYMVWQQ